MGPFLGDVCPPNKNQLFRGLPSTEKIALRWIYEVVKLLHSYKNRETLNLRSSPGDYSTFISYETKIGLENLRSHIRQTIVNQSSAEEVFGAILKLVSKETQETEGRYFCLGRK